MSGPADYVRRHGPRQRGRRAVLIEVAAKAHAVYGMDDHGDTLLLGYRARVSAAQLLGSLGSVRRQTVSAHLVTLAREKWIERVGRAYWVLGVAEHDAAVSLCDHPDCVADARRADAWSWRTAD